VQRGAVVQRDAVWCSVLSGEGHLHLPSAVLVRL